jgi:D-amino-acid oxidase
MWALSAPGGPAEGCFLRIREDEYFAEPIANPEVLQVMPDVRSPLSSPCYDALISQQFKALQLSSLPPDTVQGVTFTTLTIDSPIYLNYLLSRFLAAGGSIVRGTVQHIAQVVEGGAGIFDGRKCLSSPAAVVVCVGLGARTLGGVEDKDMYPIRGQTVLLRAPWVKFGRAISSKDGLWTYIIPRRSGDVRKLISHRRLLRCTLDHRWWDQSGQRLVGSCHSSLGPDLISFSGIQFLAQRPHSTS